LLFGKGHFRAAWRWQDELGLNRRAGLNIHFAVDCVKHTEIIYRGKIPLDFATGIRFLL
jgi:hypothetical protein